MGSPIPLKNASDSYVSEIKPSKNFSQVNKLFLADGTSSDTRYAFIYFGVPSGMAGKTILSAELQLYSGSGFAGSVTLTAQRLSAKFGVNRVNWTNRPGVTGSTVAVAKTGAADGTMWAFNTTSIMQAVANGAPWYGFRISATGAAAKWLYSAQAKDAYRPVLVITWSDSPDAPERLIPDKGKAVSVAKPTLQWDFTDPSGDQTMQSFQLRLFTTEAAALTNTGWATDTGTVASDIPQVDLDSTAYAGLSVGSTVWWRVLVTDGAGLTSSWSEPAYFTRTAKGVLTITNPATGGTPFVNEATPPFSWTFTGVTQRAFEVILTTPESPGQYIWTSGIMTSTDVAITPPPNKIKEIGKTYRLIVRIYDAITRISVPDDPIYVEQSVDFIYQYSAAVSPVTAFTAVPSGFKPEIVLQWTSSTAPDEFVIIRDNEAILEEQPSVLLVSGTTYTYTDDEASPRRDHTWKVARKVGAVTSSANPSVTERVRVVAPTLSRLGGGDSIIFVEPSVAAARGSVSDVHYILGDAPPVLITQSLRGYEGTVSGMLISNHFPGMTAESQLADLEDFRDNPGQILKLIWVDKAMRVVVYNVTDQPVANPDGTVEYLASFDFIEVGF